MSIINSLLSLVAPHECLGCRREGALICSGCLARLTIAPESCYHCRRPMPGGRTCQDCARRSHLTAVQAGTAYEGLAKQLIWLLKFGGAQAAVRPMADCLARLVPAGTPVVIVPVPTATSRQRRRGYDQATLLARELSRHCGVMYLPCLRRLGQAHQVGAGRAQRLAQLADAFEVARPLRVRGKHILLIDDVITTGATFEAAAEAMLAAGADSVSALAFARP